jgi:hypothetical protein
VCIDILRVQYRSKVKRSLAGACLFRASDALGPSEEAAALREKYGLQATTH